MRVLVCVYMCVYELQNGIVTPAQIQTNRTEQAILKTVSYSADILS